MLGARKESNRSQVVALLSGDAGREEAMQLVGPHRNPREGRLWGVGFPACEPTLARLQHQMGREGVQEAQEAGSPAWPCCRHLPSELGTPS